MEEHGEMPSAGPIISGIKPPQDGWKYVTKSAYMMMGENEVKILEADGSDAQVWIQINSLVNIYLSTDIGFFLTRLDPISILDKM